MTAASSLLASTTLVSVALIAALVHSRRALRSANKLIGELQAREEQEHSALRERSAMDALKNEFISTVSHELRTPLTSIRGSLGLLSSGVFGPTNTKGAKLLRIATSNTDRLIRLVNDILDLERMESGRAPLDRRRCSLPELADIAIESLHNMAEAAGVRIEFVPSLTADGLFFDGDPDRIVQVLTNLVSNAIKFSSTGTAIEIHAEATAEAIQLRVVDQGRGIPADKLESIFDRFQQVDDTDARQKGGTGLGLAICRTIVEQHGGSIWASRNPGSGSTFYIILPRTARTDDAVATPAPVVASGEGSILVCDDDSSIRTVVCEHLARQGYTCLEASSGKDAIALAESEPVDAILLDLYMPGLSGWETMQHLRSSRATAHIPIVILSVLDPTLRNEMAGGAQGWVQKPFHELHLFAEIGRVLSARGVPAEVLLVEDDLDLATVLTSSFSGSEIAVRRVATRQEAIRHCVSNRPDLVILDLGLPDGDGLSLVSWLQRQPGLTNLPLIVHSGRDVSEPERAALRLGPTQFITKTSVQTSDVEALVRSMVHSLRHAPRPVAAGTTLSSARAS